jgi:dTDP-4-amino-4,6-dideoxygalactose transaminase
MIPFKVLPLGKEEKEAVNKVLDIGNLGSGKIVKELEERFAEYVGSKFAVAVHSCTDALFLSLKYSCKDNNFLLPIEVEIPSMTVPLVANTIIHCGGHIKFADEYNWVGHHYELKPYKIIDSAHEVSKDEFKHYSDDTLMCFSFYPTKPVSSCNGGMICTNNEKAVEWIRKARFYGRNSGNEVVKNSWEYDIEFAGWKMDMSEVQAAIALEQLKKLPDLSLKRQSVVDHYNVLLEEHNTSLYLYRINVNQRDLFIQYMKSAGVECGVHFKPLHLMKAYEGLIYLPKTELVGEMTVSLPLYDSLTNNQIEYIATAVKDWRRING